MFMCIFISLKIDKAKLVLKLYSIKKLVVNLFNINDYYDRLHAFCFITCISTLMGEELLIHNNCIIV